MFQFSTLLLQILALYKQLSEYLWKIYTLIRTQLSLEPVPLGWEPLFLPLRHLTTKVEQFWLFL